MSAVLQVLSCKLPANEFIVEGVTIEPYILLRRPDAAGTTTTADEIPEEGCGGSRYSLRFRWYRSVVNRGGALCWVHGDTEATLQCVLCLRAKVDVRKSYHCSTDCFRKHWHLHRDLHGQPAQRNGFVGGEGAHTQPDNGFKGAQSTYSNGGETWMEIGKGRLYTPISEDVGSVLKVEVVVIDSSFGVPREAGYTFSVSTTRVKPAPVPPKRDLVALPPLPKVSLHAEGRFTVLSYNILADLYATKEVFPYCPAWVLSWHYRKQVLLMELRRYNADILCLQEVQSTHFLDFWRPRLAEDGYDAIFKKKGNDLYIGGNVAAIDGCATFFKRSRFQLVKKYEVEFNKAAQSLSDSHFSPEQKKQAQGRLMKDNVALIAVLEATEAPGRSVNGDRRQLVCVANTHVHSNPELTDVKLWQVHTLLKGLEKIAVSADIPMLVAGDFNSTPGSAAHALLVKRSVPSSHPELAADPLGILRPSTKLQHTLPLASAYAAVAEAAAHSSDGGAGDQAAAALERQRKRVDDQHHEPKFTNLTRTFKGTLDYILYTSNSLAPTAVLELPEELEVKPRHNTGLPNETWCSDHIALLAEFAFRQS